MERGDKEAAGNAGNTVLHTTSNVERVEAPVTIRAYLVCSSSLHA